MLRAEDLLELLRTMRRVQRRLRRYDFVQLQRRRRVFRRNVLRAEDLLELRRPVRHVQQWLRRQHHLRLPERAVVQRRHVHCLRRDRGHVRGLEPAMLLGLERALHRVSQWRGLLLPAELGLVPDLASVIAVTLLAPLSDTASTKRP